MTARRFSMSTYLITAIVTILVVCGFFLKGKGSFVKIRTVTELITTPFGYPNPFKLNYVAEYRFVHQVGEFLVRRDNLQNIIGGLAASWTISTDRSEIVFNLRPNLYTAEEVAQSLKRLRKAKQTSHSNLAHQILNESDIGVVDELHLKIKTVGDAGAMLAPLVMADAVIIPDSSWINIPGFDEPQVDWTKTKGPYVHASGQLTEIAKSPVVFRPNKNHYFFSEGQLDWKLSLFPAKGFKDLSSLKEVLDREPSFTTMRYWELVSLFFTPSADLLFYETRPNGISFLIPNTGREMFATQAARVSFLKKLFNTKLDILNQENRAYQIPQPGLSGRMMPAEWAAVVAKIESAPDLKTAEPMVWSVPNDDEVNREWIKQAASAMGLNHIFKEGPYLRKPGAWNSSEYDLMVSSIGMSDTDPISGATFLFSPNAVGLDYPDGRILKLLNHAKDTIDRTVITATVREAFKMAIEAGLLFPISYTTNRHYYSPGVELNIQDPYSESIRIWEVRLKD